MFPKPNFFILIIFLCSLLKSHIKSWVSLVVQVKYKIRLTGKPTASLGLVVPYFDSVLFISSCHKHNFSVIVHGTLEKCTSMSVMIIYHLWSGLIWLIIGIENPHFSSVWWWRATSYCNHAIYTSHHTVTIKCIWQWGARWHCTVAVQNLSGSKPIAIPSPYNERNELI